jgi:plastocyanin
MTKWLAMLMACLALALAAAGCGDDDDEGGGGGEATEEPAPTGDGKEDAAEPGGKTVEVSMQNIAFDPESVTVDKGGTVRWTNEESVGHDVTKTGGPGPEFSSGDPGGMGQGDSYEETFQTAGKIQYVCTVHADMKGTITVK